MTLVESKADNVFAGLGSALKSAGRNLAEMNSLPTFRVVGIHPNGERVFISQHDSREAAERAVRLIQFGSNYTEIVIESKGGAKS